MKLTTRQKKLLYLLSINCRFSQKDLAKALRMSEDAVAYQINKLIHKEKLGHFNVQFDYFRLGYKQNHIWIKLQHPQDYSFLEKYNEIISINSSFGKFDLQLVTLTKSRKSFEKLITKIKKSLRIQKFEISEFVDFYKRFTNIIPPIRAQVKIQRKKQPPIYELNTELYAKPLQDKIRLDKKDIQIIRLLLQNPRITYQEISRLTKLNHETIRYRINNYIRERLIVNFGIIHNFQKYGLYTTYLLLKLKKPDYKIIERALENNQHTFYAAKLKGTYNAIIYLVSSDPREFGREFSSIKEKLDPMITDIDLLFLDKLHKYVQFPIELLSSQKN